MTYKFKKDSKVTVWQRDYITVEADSPEEAYALMKENALEDFSCLNDERITYDRTETLFDTIEVLPVEENDNQATVEIYHAYHNNSKLIFDNTK